MYFVKKIYCDRNEFNNTTKITIRLFNVPPAVALITQVSQKT